MGHWPVHWLVHWLGHWLGLELGLGLGCQSVRLGGSAISERADGTELSMSTSGMKQL